VLQTQEQQHSIIYGTQQRQRMHVLLVQLQVGLVSKKGVHFIIILPPFSFYSPISSWYNNQEVPRLSSH